jgi:hypothetical protein
MRRKYEFEYIYQEQERLLGREATDAERYALYAAATRYSYKTGLMLDVVKYLSKKIENEDIAKQVEVFEFKINRRLTRTERNRVGLIFHQNNKLGIKTELSKDMLDKIIPRPKRSGNNGTNTKNDKADAILLKTAVEDKPPINMVSLYFRNRTGIFSLLGVQCPKCKKSYSDEYVIANHHKVCSLNFVEDPIVADD